MKDLEIQIEECITGVADLRMKEYGMKYCRLQFKHPCPYRNDVKFVKFNKSKEEGRAYYYLCRKN